MVKLAIGVNRVFLELFSISVGCHAELPTKKAVEMAHIRQSDRLGNLVKRIAGGRQGARGILHALCIDEFGRGHAIELFHRA